MTWRCTGIRWSDGRPAIGWTGRADRDSPLALGQRLAFTALGERRCLGVRRAGRRTPCPTGQAVPGRIGNAQCPECARLDRSFSVAADTNAADPRPYRVYLAWFGPDTVKVGITAEERGPARLLEQGAVTWTWLGRGPLMAARRTEELLRAALGVPDRIAYARKRVLRGLLPPESERAREVAELHARSVALPGWPDSLERLPCDVTDHAVPFGLAGLPVPARVVTELVPGGTVAGVPVGAAGPDLHFADGLVLDGRLLAGWELVAVPAAVEAVTDVLLAEIAPPAPETEQDGLF
ncbi:MULTISPECIES: DUF2797 domain-containing protein [unclassified Streptomyces]|uniref:DUF2797 domain-containing protein n=1 Tax=unclassified Streptomyces TaxID=2593676 RepID=UPI002481E0C5|nr:MULTISPECIES: DUF2797 domain-containing protein [unclassified Streptomyces]MDA5286119.1 DUF2797 domain-containing protein [Streptomyces sp. Isolate_45]MDX2390257.1 DUF2797 domain-containing protein [Streptomyces sp. DK15]